MAEKLSPYFDGKFSFLGLENRRWVLSFSSFVAGVLVLIIYFQTRPTSETYVAAQESFTKWISSGDEASYLEMRKALKKVPSLERKYAAAIAQKLFEKGSISEALLFAHHSLESLKEDVPFHAAYGETSLLIEQGSYQDALQRSVALKEEMKGQSNFSHKVGDYPEGGSYLFAHNLLRIACLQKELHNRHGEKAAWEELETFLSGNEELGSQVFEGLCEKEVSFSEYIAERKKQLLSQAE